MNEKSKLTLAQKILLGLRPSHIMMRSWRTKASILLIAISIACGFATYAALTETPPFGHNPDIVIWLLNFDLIVLLLLSSLIARRLVGLWSGRKRKIAGSHLHVRLVYIFSILAAAPTIIMTVFSAFFFHFGVQTWFSQRVQTAINESQAVAQSYLEEHKQVIKADTMAMADDLDRQADMLLLNPEAFQKVMDTQSMFRNLSEAIVFQGKGKVIATSSLTFSLAYEEVPDYALANAQSGDVVLMTGENKDRVRALVKLDNFENTYLFVGRMVDPQVLSHLNSTQMAVEDYADLQAKSSGLQITVTMIFVVVGLLLVFAAIWFGLILARQLVRPISDLISAADRVRAGDFTTRVAEQKNLDEFDYLAQSFNRMTAQIQEQQSALIETNRQLDRRRHLTETVLAGVSSGVIGLDGGGIINLANNSAMTLLGKAGESLTGRRLIDLLPELDPLLRQSREKPEKIMQAEILVMGRSGEKRTFLFRVAVETMEDGKNGIILTFDDITDLQSAQRKAAWSDVARRIAHEIKNPLTPIQLSAERLKRKYLSQISEDPETFAQCTDTIIRHVGDIGRMVNEFSSFARMPEPVLRPENIIGQVREALVLPTQAERDIKFLLHMEDGLPDTVVVNVDAQQIRQAMTNILQNAADAVRMKNEGGQGGRVNVLLGRNGAEEFFIAVTDNGIGFPKDEAISRLTEPYVTHKPKGTGLGLAIVKKIMEDNHGHLILGAPDWLRARGDWKDIGGACVLLLLPVFSGEESLDSNKDNGSKKVA